tara:strand:- start:4125 stop:4460 length:336 start_codon:yes stop_codon:yes gene_type:complete
MKKKIPEGGKYIMFPSLENLDVNLIIKLNFDDITKFFFFNEYIKGYLNEDEDLMPFINKVKEKSMLARKFRLKKAKQLRKREQEIINRFGLNQKEIENIFDLIEDDRNGGE